MLEGLQPEYNNQHMGRRMQRIDIGFIWTQYFHREAEFYVSNSLQLQHVVGMNS